MPLFDAKQVLAEIAGGKVTTLDLSGAVVKKEEKSATKATATLSGHVNIVSVLRVLPDGRLASGSADKTIRLWDIKSETCMATLRGHTHHIYALTVLPDGRLASGSFDATIRLWDTKSETCVATLNRHTNFVFALTVLPDGRLASGFFDKTIRLWDVKNETCVATLSGHTARVCALTMLPDGRLASGSSNSTIRLWDIKSETCMAALSGHAGSVEALTVLPDGRLASGSLDKTIRLWDTKSKTCMPTLSGHAGGVEALTILPDGRLASGSYDDTIKLWDCGLRPLPWSRMREVIVQLKHYPSISKVNLQNTAISDADISELVAIFQINKAVTELNLINTQVTAQGAEIFYQSLPLNHPLRDGLRHEAMFNILCNEILEHFFSYPLIRLMMDYVFKKNPRQNIATTSDKKNDVTAAQQTTRIPFTFFNHLPSIAASPTAASTINRNFSSSPTIEETQGGINAHRHGG